MSAAINPKLPQYTIYCATCKVNGKKYIGKTSQAIWTRWKFHLTDADRIKRGLRHTKGYPAIINDLVTHGDDAFDLEVLEICLSQAHMDEREVWWMMELKTVFPFGYNKSVGQKMSLTIEEREHLREILIENNGRSTKVQAIKDGNILNFNTIREFCESIGITMTKWHDLKRMNVRSINGYDFTYGRRAS